jgi:hypothetical protein
MTRRKRSPLKVLLGLLLIVAGLAGVVVGIVAVIGERDRIDDEAVAEGTLPAQLDFTAETREYRVFVISGDAESDSTGTACRTPPAPSSTAPTRVSRSRSATPPRSGPSTAPPG